MAGEPTANFLSTTREFKKELAPNTEPLPNEEPLAHTQFAPIHTLSPITIFSTESFPCVAVDFGFAAAIFPYIFNSFGGIIFFNQYERCAGFQNTDYSDNRKHAAR